VAAGRRRGGGGFGSGGGGDFGGGGASGGLVMMQRLRRMFRPPLARRVGYAARDPAAVAQRVAERVAASERRHSGEIRVYIEAGLPLSYLWRDATPRERAIAMFGKLRVWDTEHNNGVLVYLLLAEHAIEIVADRGLARHVPQAQWEQVVQDMRGAFPRGPLRGGARAGGGRGERPAGAPLSRSRRARPTPTSCRTRPCSAEYLLQLRVDRVDGAAPAGLQRQPRFGDLVDVDRGVEGGASCRRCRC
jgi:hypothetical protein